MRQSPPTKLWQIPIIHGKTHYTWPFSIAMFVITGGSAHRCLEALDVLRFEGNPWDQSHDDSMVIQWNLQIYLC